MGPPIDVKRKCASGENAVPGVLTLTLQALALIASRQSAATAERVSSNRGVPCGRGHVGPHKTPPDSTALAPHRCFFIAAIQRDLTCFSIIWRRTTAPYTL